MSTYAVDENAPNPAWTILDSQDQWQSFSQLANNDPENPLVQSSLLLDGLRAWL